MASLGGGDGSSNTERDLHRWLDGAFGMQLQIRTVPIEVDLDGDTVEIQHPVIEPRDLVAELWNAGPSVFRRSMLGTRDEGSIEQYWANNAHQEWVTNHPHLQNRNTWAKTLPVWIHGDEARAFVQQKLLILSWMSALVTGCSWSSRMLYTVLPHELLSGDQKTLQGLLMHFAKSINALQGKRVGNGELRILRCSLMWNCPTCVPASICGRTVPSALYVGFEGKALGIILPWLGAGVHIWAL
eukprot:13824983-Alexandrium_andersonii.AAC.1